MISAGSKGVVKKVWTQLKELGVDVNDDMLRYGDHKIVLDLRKVTSEHIQVLKYADKASLEIASMVLNEHTDVAEIGNAVSNINWSEAVGSFQDWNNESRLPTNWLLANKFKKGFTHEYRCNVGNIVRRAIEDGISREGLREYGKCASDSSPMEIQLIRSAESCRLSLQIVAFVKRRTAVGVQKGLHHSLCWGMGKVAAINPTDVICDPCCGKGSILTECASWFPALQYIGTDIDGDQLSAAANNARVLNAHNVVSRISLLECDAGCLPLRPESVDVVLSDLPFGRKYGSLESNSLLYPSLCKELERILVPSGRGVLLTSLHQLGCLKDALCSAGLLLVESVQFQFGGSNSTNSNICVMCCIVKTSSDNCKKLFDIEHLHLLNSKSDNIGWMNVKPSMVQYSK